MADRRAARGYIVHCVIGLHESADPHAAHVRMMCFDGGSFVADAVFDALADPAPGGAACSPEVAGRRRLVRLALRVRAEPVTPANAPRWARLALLRARAGRAG